MGERLGVPSVGIMTTAFASAAELMARALGATGYRFVVVEHPISSATLQDLEQQAREASTPCASILTGSEGD